MNIHLSKCIMKKRTKKIMKINFVILLIIALTIAFFNQSCSSAMYSSKDIKMNKIKNSLQYSDGKFKNFVEWEQPSFGEYIGTMWDFIFAGGQRTPSDSLPRVKADLSPFIAEGNNQLNVTWAGHSSLLINIDGFRILTDPVFEKSVSFFGPTRYNGEIPFDIDQLPEIDIVLISHNHYDHLNKFTIERIHEKVKRFVVPLAVGAELEEWGVPREKITELDWWDEFKPFTDLMIAATPAQHFSGRGLTDRDETLWVSYVVQSDNYKIYFSGDSGYFEGFKLIGNKYGPFDMTFLECGAYNEKWHHIHMYPEETVQAHLDLKGNILHPIHWGTFNLSLHSWFDPMNRLSKSAETAGVKVATPVAGGTTIYPDSIPENKWWKIETVDEKKVLSKK